MHFEKVQEALDRLPALKNTLPRSEEPRYELQKLVTEREFAYAVELRVALDRLRRLSLFVL